MREHLPPMPKQYDNQAMLAALRPAAEDLLKRHLDSAEEWFPHEMVPWSQGRDYAHDEAWDPEGSPLDETLQHTIHADLLDLENFPGHFRTLTLLSPPEHPLRNWAKRYTAEKIRHAITVRDWAAVTRAIDLCRLERDRMHAVSAHDKPSPSTVIEGLAQCSLHADESQRRHAGLSLRLADRAGQLIMTKIAEDDGRHYDFYQGLAVAAWQFDAESMMAATVRQIVRARLTTGRRG